MRTCILAVLLAVSSLTAFAQADRGTITGTIVDPAGAVVANATIQIRNLDTGSLYPSASSETGNFTVAQLPPGPYELQVTTAGFKQYRRGPLTVQVARSEEHTSEFQSRGIISYAVF